MSVLVGYRIQQIREEGVKTVHNIVRIHAEKGAPSEYVIAKKAIDYLDEPLYVKNGRALVSAGKIHNFAVGQRIKDSNARITFVSDNIDLNSGMFVVRVSGNITGNVMVQKEYNGFFLPLDAVLPKGANVVAKDFSRMVVSGLNDGEKVIVR
jgi:hypothetical protein